MLGVDLVGERASPSPTELVEEAGRYRIFLQVAPGGEPIVFPFAIDVVAAGVP